MSKRHSTFHHRNLPLLLLQARESVISRFRPILNEQGVTEQQWRILRVLADRGPMEPRELVESCQISSPSITGVLARMEETGMVTRERMAHDQRRITVALTPASQALATRVAPRVDAIYAELESRLGLEFTRQLYATLDQLIASV